MGVVYDMTWGRIRFVHVNSIVSGGMHGVSYLVPPVVAVCTAEVQVLLNYGAGTTWKYC